jgi:hypothetical protein
MCHLLIDPSYEVQRMGYNLLHKAARKRTEHFVIESAVDTEDNVSAELPAELLAILQSNFTSIEEFHDSESDNIEVDLSELYKVSGYLLAWMIMFDLFIDAVSTDLGLKTLLANARFSLSKLGHSTLIK